MQTNPVNAVNRGVYISDNLPFLQSLNDNCVDLVCIDPPFAKNETFGRKNSKSPDPLKPPLAQEERDTELALLRRWGIRNEATATAPDHVLLICPQISVLFTWPVPLHVIH